ncbi:MAG TPA: 3-hydroxyacyl-CoA dehydrogenase NAD-binding domain-containing protein [Gemmatimonadales bacterium]|jgi:3-hydroxyacyl-CoA dehydrogenase|nr:3-hydroxyacyl-CoA dehydrogenase NAD-binding domain-containing protein [Gemmatimonadales bacterium]
MIDENNPRLAVIGVGEVGRGWAALAASHGWAVAVFDTDSAALHAAHDDIAGRVDRLADAGQADRDAADAGLAELRSGRSLLQAVADADWIIEAIPDDLAVKQRLLEQIEQVARLKAVLTSSSSRLHASELCGRLRRPERLLVAHPLMPVELIPAVEVVPGPRTDPACTDDVRYWLRRLGKVPVLVQKEVRGNVTGRLQAAVWRELVQLVLDGVVDVKDLDAAVSLGPGVTWAAAGPGLTHVIGAGDRPLAVTLGATLTGFEEWWPTLARWEQLGPEERLRLARALEKAYGARAADLREERAARLFRVLAAVEDAVTREEDDGVRLVQPPSH